MNNNLGTLFFNLLCNLGDYSNIYTATQVFSAVPDLEFLACFQRQRGREIIKEQLW